MCIFFNWVCRKGGEGSGHSLGCSVYNETLVIHQKSQLIEEELQVLDEMSKRKVLVNEGTHGVLLNRFAAAHKVEETIGVFNRRKEFGLESDFVAFQKFLMSLYRIKHVEAIETLFHSN